MISGVGERKFSPNAKYYTTIKRVSYGYRSFRNFKARIMLMERYKIQKGNIHSYKFAMDAAA